MIAKHSKESKVEIITELDEISTGRKSIEDTFPEVNEA